MNVRRRLIIFVTLILFLFSCRNTRKEYYKNGNIKSIVRLNKENRYNGKAEFYYENGKIKKLVFFDNGDIKECKVFYPNGQIKWESPFLNNVKHGNYFEYYQNGGIKKKILFSQDTIIRSSIYDSLGNMIYEYVKVDTCNISEFDTGFVKILSNGPNSSRIQLHVPGIPSSQLVPDVVNGHAKLLNRVEGIWEFEVLNEKKPTYIGIRILLDNNKYYSLGYNVYSHFPDSSPVPLSKRNF